MTDSMRAAVVHRLLSLSLAAAAVWAIVSVPYLPTNDGPQHVMSAYIQNHFSDPPYSTYLVPEPQFAEHGFSVLFVPLEAALGFPRALHVALSILVVSFAASFSFLVRRLVPSRRELGLLGFALAFWWPLYMGFFAFTVGTALGFFAVALALPDEDEDRGGSWHRSVVLSLVFAVAAVAHVVAAAIAGFVALAVRLSCARSGERFAAAARLSPAGVFPMLLLALAAHGHSDIGLRNLDRAVWEPLDVWVRELPRIVLPGPEPRALLASFIVVASLLAAWRRMRDGVLTDAERGILLSAATLVCAGLVSPMTIPGWQFFAPRFLVVGSLLAVTLLPVERLARGSRALVPALSALVSVFASARLHRTLYDGCADAFSGFAATPQRSGFRLPVVLRAECGVPLDPRRSDVPHLAPLTHVGGLYVASSGGLVPYMFLGSPSIYAFDERKDPEAPAWPDHPPYEAFGIGDDPRFEEDPVYRDLALTKIAAYARRYDDVLLFGTKKEWTDALVARGLVVEFSHGSFAILRVPAGT